MLDLDLTPYRNQVDILMGDVPCQSFSQAGKRKGLNDDRGDLIIKFRTLINMVEPKIFGYIDKCIDRVHHKNLNEI